MADELDPAIASKADACAGEDGNSKEEALHEFQSTTSLLAVATVGYFVLAGIISFLIAVTNFTQIGFMVWAAVILGLLLGAAYVYAHDEGRRDLAGLKGAPLAGGDKSSQLNWRTL